MSAYCNLKNIILKQMLLLNKCQIRDPKNPMSSAALNQVIIENGKGCWVHYFRSYMLYIQ